MSVYTRSEDFTHWVTIKDRTNIKVDPNVVQMNIYDPCNRRVVSNASMGKNATGEYYYYYTIPSSATYGRYDIKVVAESSTPTTTNFKDEFFVMPWDVEEEVRQISGIADEKSIADRDLSNLCWMAYQRALREVYIHHYKETPNPNVSSGAGIDGTNVYFQTKHFPLADSNGDGVVSGNTSSCATDVTGWWLSSTGAYSKLDIAITQSENGTIEIYQADGTTALPSNNNGVYLDYWVRYESFNQYLFQQAVCFLAAHYLAVRMKSVDHVTIADLARNTPILIKDERRFYKEYQRLMNLIRRPRISGV